MKKTTILTMLLCSCLLTGCMADTTSDSIESIDIQMVSTPQYTYTDTEDFLNSDYCDVMEESGFTPLVFGHYEEKYTLAGIDTDQNTYTFHFVHTASGESLQAAITYDAAEADLDALKAAISVTDGETVQVNIAGWDCEGYQYQQDGMQCISYVMTNGFTCTIRAKTDDPAVLRTYMGDLGFYEKAYWLTVFGKNPNPEETLPTEMHVDIDNYENYETLEAFLASDFCTKMQEKGYAIYLPSYDESRFELLGIGADASFYDLNFMDHETERGVSCTITYGAYETSVEQFDDNVRIPIETEIMTAEKDGVTYDVYVAKKPLTEETEYYMAYLPMESYKMSIHSGSSTPEEALSYLHEFDLVPVEAGSE